MDVGISTLKKYCKKVVSVDPCIVTYVWLNQRKYRKECLELDTELNTSVTCLYLDSLLFVLQKTEHCVPNS